MSGPEWCPKCGILGDGCLCVAELAEDNLRAAAFKMTPEAQRVAIAEACGWTRIGKTDDGRWVGRSPNDFVGYITYDDLPDYLSDLNAMHEAEKTLVKRQKTVYGDRLADVLNLDDDYYTERSELGDRIYSLNSYLFREVAHATATQRAEAFLRTLNLWKDQ